VYGQQIADNNAAIERQNALIASTQETMASTQATMANLQAAVDRQEATLRGLADLPRRMGDSSYDGTYRGAKDGVAGVAANAGQRMAQSQGPGWGQYWR
jgi:hypothetical protein